VQAKRLRSRAALTDIEPLIKPLLKPVVEPVIERLDRSEKLLRELKAALDIQFKRIAQIQAQLDILAASLDKRRR
jgi:hypothetical protein